MSTVIQRHVRHIVSRLYRDSVRSSDKPAGNVMGQTACGKVFQPVSRYRYEPDRLVHEPARSRCRECYG